MILQALTEYYESLAREGKVSREGWCQAKVSYAVNLSKEGKILGIISLKQEEERGKKKVWVPAPLTVPEMVTRSSGVSANFLCDNSKYILGIDAEGTEGRVRDCFQAAKERHLDLLQGVESDMAQALRLYFQNWDPAEALNCEELKAKWEEITDGGNLIFCMGTCYAQEDPAIVQEWDRRRNVSEGGMLRKYIENQG